MMKIGYARVSTSEQDLTLQLDALAQADCSKTFTDVESGAKAFRQGLSDALSYARPGDSLVVWKLDRLGRTMKGLIDLAGVLEERHIELVSLTDGIDTKTSAGRFFFHVMAAMATMERDLMLERTKAGLEAARKKGRIGGRRPAMNKEKINVAKTLLLENVSHKDVASSLGVSLPTLYRYFPAGSFK